jgi:hypothetical protein
MERGVELGVGKKILEVGVEREAAGVLEEEMKEGSLLEVRGNLWFF